MSKEETMVERVERAIYEAAPNRYYLGPPGKARGSIVPWVDCSKDERDTARIRAIAVIDALMEPSDEPPCRKSSASSKSIMENKDHE